MVGGEIVVGSAAVQAGTKAANALAAEHKAVSGELLRQAAETEEFQRAAALYGRRQAAKQAIITRIFKPLGALVGVQRDYFDTDFAIDLAQRVDAIPSENLQSPRPNVAVPAMQGLGLVLDEPDLKVLYLELLAKASDSRAAREAHPSYVNVVAQLTSQEAQYLRGVLGGEPNLPVVSLRRKMLPSGDYNIVVNHLLNLLDDEANPVVDEQIETYIDNWVRLGLVQVSFDQHLTAPNTYDWAELRPEAVYTRQSFEHMEVPVAQGITGFELDIAHGLLRVTAFGRQFARAVGLGVPSQPDGG